MRLAITGDALAIDYLGQPEATLAAFPETQRANNQRLRSFRLPVKAARLADGSLLTGAAAVDAATAAKAAEKKRGTAEHVEELLLGHPLVRECVALSTGPSEPVTCVFATLKQGDDPRAERALREHLESQLPKESQPQALVLLARFPLNADGKPDRIRLVEQCEAVLRRYMPGPPAEVLPEKQVDEIGRASCRERV